MSKSKRITSRIRPRTGSRALLLLMAMAVMTGVMAPAIADYDDDGSDGFLLGGYGELHANFTVGSDSDKIDWHRIVFFVGYDFNEWIKFSSEFEIEHAFVSSETEGELVIEQAFVDFLLDDRFNFRVGRVLTPLGIINQKHEPPTFNGVERPSFSKYLIPSTWPSDGIGVFGGLGQAISYQAYVVGGLDGSGFSAKDGIRGGRLLERPSLNEPAVTGRIDLYPFVDSELRLGLSGYSGGLDNGNKGKNPGIDGEIQMYSADFEFSLSDLDLRGVVAHAKIDGAAEIAEGVADEIFGWYLEGGYHFWPEAWKTGKLAESDAIAFVRYDDFNTQYKMPAGVEKTLAGDRTEWTVGINFYLTHKFVVKADYQIRDDASSESLKDLFNLGIGWEF